MADLLEQYEAEIARLRGLSHSELSDPANARKAVALAGQLAGDGRGERVAALLAPLAEAGSSDPALWRNYGFALRDQQKMEEARAAFSQACSLDPENPLCIAGLAQITYETGRASADLFRKARVLAPGDGRYTLNLAHALAAENSTGEATALLEAGLADRPDWFEAHAALAGIRSSAGDTASVTGSYARACEVQPQNAQLWIAWIQVLIVMQDWAEADRVANLAREQLGDAPVLTAMRAALATESGALDEADRLFQALAGIRDMKLDISRVRHALRRRHLREGEEIASRYLSSQFAPLFWPYISLFWRLRGAPQAAWLEGNPPYVSVFDLDYTPEELAVLAQTLRRLHTAEAPYLELSVRGGTQTDRPLFFRDDPHIQLARERITAAVKRYIATLPPRDSRHPLLAPPRGRVLFEGSWSVRLSGQGFHTRHTHPRGWISSAFYVALPEGEKMGPPPAGWLTIGDAPPELGLDMPPLMQVEPKPGRLVLFPSTMWHGTEPFADGERLTIAFDVKYPPADV